MPKEVVDFGQSFTIYGNDVYSYNFNHIENYFNQHFTNKYKITTYKQIKQDCIINNIEPLVKLIYDQYFDALINNKKAEDTFDGAKLHWLVNDIKINGLSYPPQGIITSENNFSAHPGTFRFAALHLQNLYNTRFENTKIVVLDLYDKVKYDTLTFHEWLSACTTGFLRKDRKISIAKTEFNYLEVHETMNHHDDIIALHDSDLKDLYQNRYPYFFMRPNLEDQYKDNCIDNLDNFHTRWLNKSVFYIPSISRYEGVSIYVDPDVKMNVSIFCFLSLLNLTDAVLYTQDKKIIIFNNNHPDTKKLLPDVIDESTDYFLENFLWTNCKTELGSLKGVWYDF